MYGTMMCPDTVEADVVLRRNGVDLEYIDISANMLNLKEFLRLRDERQEFDKAKELGKAGVPAFLLDDGSMTFDVYSLEGVAEEKPLEEENMTCGIDGQC